MIRDFQDDCFSAGTATACEEEEYVIAGTAEELEAGSRRRRTYGDGGGTLFTAAELCSTDAELCKADAELGKTDAELGKTDAELGKTDAELGKTDAELVPAGTVSVAVALLDAGSTAGRPVDAEEAMMSLPAFAASSNRSSRGRGNSGYAEAV